MPQSNMHGPDRQAAPPFGTVFKFFGRKGTFAFIGLLVVTCTLFWVWNYEEWRPFVSAIAAALAPLLAAIATLLKDAETAAKWVLTIGAVVASAAFSWYTTSELTKQLKEQTEISEHRQERLNLLKEDIVNYTRPLPKEEYRRVQTEAGANLRKRFNDAIGRKPPFRHRDFELSTDIIDIIRKLDEENGHAHYISGEIERILGGLGKGRQRFYAYLEAERKRTRDGELGAAACRNPEGFCRERTAWIFHLLANDFYQHGLKLKSSGRAEHEFRTSFETALRHTCSAIEYFPRNGFADALQLIATRSLEKLLTDELGETCASLKRD